MVISVARAITNLKNRLYLKAENNNAAVFRAFAETVQKLFASFGIRAENSYNDVKRKFLLSGR
jgi:hypothetical protein